MYDVSKTDRAVELFVFDIYIAVLKIKKVSSNFTEVEDLLHSFTDWDSVIREFEIIGEASKYLLKHNLLDSSYRSVVDFRNSITHGYFGVDPDIVWKIIDQKLGDIENIILDLIKNIEQDLKDELIDAYIEDNSYLDFVVDKLIDLKDGK